MMFSKEAYLCRSENENLLSLSLRSHFSTSFSFYSPLLKRIMGNKK
jgi:hypothetical protein